MTVTTSSIAPEKANYYRCELSPSPQHTNTITQVDEVDIAQAEFKEYLEEQGSQYIAPSFQSLFGSTESILHHAFWLQERKEALSKRDYRRLLEEHGWKGEESKYIKVAIAFQNFSPLQLSLIEPRTIFQLAENHKKYQPVIEALQDLDTITQSAVREIIREQRKPRLPKPEEKPTVWRQTGSGPRYVQIPPIHEEDEQTGLMLQQMIESEGLTVQAIIRDAIALRQAYKEGRLVEVEDLSLDVEGTMEEYFQESDAITFQDEAIEVEVVTPEQPALFTLQIDSQLTESLVRPQLPTLSREEKSLYEMGMLDEGEFGDGEPEPAAALKNSEDRLNQIQRLLQEYQVEIGMEEDAGNFGAIRRIKGEIKRWLEEKKREIWQAYQYTKANGIKMEVYEVRDSDSVTYEYRISS
jgi:hypothetical protein